MRRLWNREDEEARCTKVGAKVKGALPHGMLSPSDTAIVFLLALLLFGPEQLPRIARQLGEAMRHIQTTTQTFMNEMERAARAHEIPPPPLPPADEPAEGVDETAEGVDETPTALQEDAEQRTRSGDVSHAPPASAPD